jgi:hypothetical protein
MFAFALESQPEKDYRYRNNAAMRTKGTTNLPLHERFVMKAEAIFPGAEIVSHQVADLSS